MDFAGTWAGALEMPGAELEMIFHITSDVDGMWSGTLDVPAQGAGRNTLSDVSSHDGVVILR